MKQDTFTTDDQRWASVTDAYKQLISHLEAVPEDSMHAIKASTHLKKVNSLSEDWLTLGEDHLPGRKKTIFLTKGNENEFTAQLTQLITDNFDPARNKMKTGEQYATLSSFFALLYDEMVRLELATGIQDISAFLKIINTAGKNSVHGEQFKLSNQRLNAYINQWNDFAPSQKADRWFLHQISINEVKFAQHKRNISGQRIAQQVVIEHCKRYGILPDAGRNGE